MRRPLRTRTGVGAATILLALTACSTTNKGGDSAGKDADGAITSDASAEPGTTEGSAAATTSGATASARATAGGTTAGGSPRGGTTAGGTSGTGGSTSGSSGGSTSGSSGGSPRTGNAPTTVGHAPGLTATTIKIGFLALNKAGTAAAVAAAGATVPEQGDPKDQVDALADYINARGGIAGRKIETVVIERDPNSSDPQHMESICRSFTEDHKVFAVVANYADDTQECYAKHKTLFLNDGVESLKRTTANNPFLWVPGVVSMEGGYLALVDSLKAQGFFDGDVRVGIAAWDKPDTRYAYDTYVLPRLKTYGVKPTVSFIKQAEGASAQAEDARQIQNTQLKFSSEKVNRVFFMAPGAGMPLIFMNNAESQQYRPRYGFSTYDSPGLLLQPAAPREQLRGSVGAGFLQITDVDRSNGDPFPTGKAETECMKALESSGFRPPNRGAAFVALFFCDGAFLLEAAAKGLNKSLTIQSWAEQVGSLGTSFQAAYSLAGGTRFDVGSRHGGQFYRHLAYVDSCSCFRYASPNKQLPPTR